MTYLFIGLCIFIFLFALFLYVYMCWLLCPYFDSLFCKMFDRIRNKFSKNSIESWDDEW